MDNGFSPMCSDNPFGSNLWRVLRDGGANVWGRSAAGGEEAKVQKGAASEVFSRKVFVGGLPLDIREDEIKALFSRFGGVLVDWPRRGDIGMQARGARCSGYVFLVYECESSVHSLVASCYKEDERFYLLVSSPSMPQKPVQVRPWRLSDSDHLVNDKMKLDPRKTVFIGGVPRPLKAVELANVFEKVHGDVCYVGIDVDPELRYPKGAARVSFSTNKAFIAALASRFIQIRHSEMEKRLELKPYVMDEQMCDECYGMKCNGKYAPYFCPNVSCLQYYCEPCWMAIHTQTPSRQKHQPMTKINESGHRQFRRNASNNMQNQPLSHQMPPTPPM